MSSRDSFSNLLDKIINIYGSLLPLLKTEYLNDKGISNSIIEYAKFLKDIRREEDFTPLHAWPPDKIFYFFKFLLDASGIVSATEGSFYPLGIGDAHIGPKREIKKIFSGDDDKLDDWMCSILFQGWVKHKKRIFKISKDLRYVVPRQNGRNVCDFKIEGNNVQPTLVECKRKHPAANDKPYNEILSRVVQNIVDGHISKARQQFKDTEERLNEGKFYKLLILDIASYGSASILELEDMEIVGLQKDSDIDSTIDELKRYPITGIDEIIICWSNVYYFDGAPRSFVYYTYPLRFHQNKKNKVNYQGWTIEYYPCGKQTYEYRELRISSTARERNWIKASWYSQTDNLLTWGEEESL